VIAELAGQGVSRRTLFRAKREAGVRTELRGGEKGGRTIWQLAEAAEEPTPTPSPSASEGQDGPLSLALGLGTLGLGTLGLGAHGLGVGGGYRRSPEDGPYYGEP